MSGAFKEAATSWLTLSTMAFGVPADAMMPRHRLQRGRTAHRQPILDQQLVERSGKVLRQAKRFGRVMTGSSDYHGEHCHGHTARWTSSVEDAPVARWNAFRKETTPGCGERRLGAVETEYEVIEQLRDQLRAVTAELATEKGLRLKAEDDRDRLQKRVNDYVRDHSALMHRYEKRQEKIRELDKQIKQFQTVAEFNKMKHEKTVETNTKLKEQVERLKGELTAARDDLKKEGGGVGALEEAREQARVAKESNAKLEKSVENTKRDFEFTRQQYQEASSRAAELGGQNSELEEQVQALKIQASDEKRRLREMNLQSAQKKDLAKIESLEQENRGMQV
ncbi:MAG: hypothetical protein M1823_006564, partial [Watsoniomyces obsoletus]